MPTLEELQTLFEQTGITYEAYGRPEYRCSAIVKQLDDGVFVTVTYGGEVIDEDRLGGSLTEAEATLRKWIEEG